MGHILESGKDYTLADIFSGDNRIIIPDLQRDYCWGDKAWDKGGKQYKELVADFVANLIESFRERLNSEENTMTMGLIYGYEQPHHHIQLCDGQQRITTLFLLLGMINRRTGNMFRERLMSDAELADDKEPYLQYSIRESTLYFMSDLVDKFFINDGLKLTFEDIKKQEWYFAKEYDIDASVVSMIEAIKSIEKVLSENKDVDMVRFGRFVINNLKILYYDMGDRVRGEETFVIINTTGEPLTATENLKPILLGKLDNRERKCPNEAGESDRETTLEYYSRQWEDREEWFWQNRTATSLTADGGMKDFFVWYWQIRLLQEQSYKNKKAYPHNPLKLFQKEPESKSDEAEQPAVERWKESIKLDTVQQYFQALKKLVEICSNDENVATVLASIAKGPVDFSWLRKSSTDVVLPLIAYLEKYPDAQYFRDFVRRIRRNYFDNEYERGSSYIDWRHIIQIVESSVNEIDALTFDTTSRREIFKVVSNVTLSEWFDQDEKNKNILKVNHRAKIEAWEDHPGLMGRLTPLWLANDEREITIENLEQIWETFSTLDSCYKEKWSQKTPQNYQLSNFVRFYGVLVDSRRIGHIQRTSGMTGAWFSWRDLTYKGTYKRLISNKVTSLLRFAVSDILDEVKRRIRQDLPLTEVVFSQNEFSAAKHLRAWMLVKVLNAEKNNILLSFYDGNGLASYEDIESNTLTESMSYSLGNSICGYALKSPRNCIIYAGSDWWGKSEAFDTIIDNTISLDEFNNREDILIAEDKIMAIDDKITMLLNEFYENDNL